MVIAAAIISHGQPPRPLPKKIDVSKMILFHVTVYTFTFIVFKRSRVVTKGVLE